MVPRLSPRGTSFKGAALYYLHDKEALTAERVDWTHTENLPTNDPEKAWRWMAYTALHAEDLKRQNGTTTCGRKSSKPVFTFSLSWHPEEEPEREHMVMTGRSALQALGLEEHQVLMVAHNDEAHRHLHLLCSTIHPETGRAHTMAFTKLELSRWAEEYERVHGKIYCDLRVENNEKRRENKRKRDEERERKGDKKIKGDNVYNKDPYDEKRKQIAGLYREAKGDGRAFKAAVEKAGYKLAQGKKILLVDGQGKEFSLARVIGGSVKEKNVRETLRDLQLQQIDELKAQQEKTRKESEKRAAEEEERKRKEARRREESESGKQARKEPTPQMQSAARKQEAVKKTLAERVAQKPEGYFGPPVPAKINRLEDRQREEIAKFHDTTRLIRARVERQVAREFGDGEEASLRKQIEASEKKQQEMHRVQRLWQIVLRRRKEEEERLERMKLKLADIENFRGVRQGRDEHEAREHEKGLKVLQERHERERVQLWDNPKATRETGQAFNTRSAPEKKIEEAERPLVELPDTLQEKIVETAHRTWPDRARESEARANDNREVAAPSRQPERQEDAPLNDNRRKENREFNRQARGEMIEREAQAKTSKEDAELYALLDQWNDRAREPQRQQAPQQQKRDEDRQRQTETARGFNQEAQLQQGPETREQETQANTGKEDAELYALLDQWNERQAPQRERGLGGRENKMDDKNKSEVQQARQETGTAGEFNQEAQTEQRLDVGQDEELYALLDQWNAQDERQMEREREEQGTSTSTTGPTESGQVQGEGAPEDAELYARLDEMNEARNSERSRERPMTLERGR